MDKDYNITTLPKEDICKPLVCRKSVNVLPSTGESSRDPKSATYEFEVILTKHIPE